MLKLKIEEVNVFLISCYNCVPILESLNKWFCVLFFSSLGKIWMICKGAESTIIHKSTSGPKDEVLQHVNDFAVVRKYDISVYLQQIK